MKWFKFLVPVFLFWSLPAVAEPEITGKCGEILNYWKERDHYKSFAYGSRCGSSWSEPNQYAADKLALERCGADCKIIFSTEKIFEANKRKRLSTEVSSDLTEKWLCKTYNTGKPTEGISSAYLFNKNFAINYFYNRGIEYLAIRSAREYEGDIIFGGTSADMKISSLRRYSECKTPPPSLYFSFAEGIALFESMDDLSDACLAGSGAGCAEEVFQFMDVSNDNRLSVAEITRFTRSLALFVAYEGFLEQEKGDDIYIELSKLTGTTIATSLAGPLVTRSLLSSYDFDGDNFLTLDEIMQDREPLLNHSPKLAGGSAIGASMLQNIVSTFVSGAIGNSTSLFGSLLGSVIR